MNTLNLLIDSLLIPLWRVHKLLTYTADLRKFESSPKDESRAQSADSSKAFRKAIAFDCLFKR